jgi:KUP system potassium uptake protein
MLVSDATASYHATMANEQGQASPRVRPPIRWALFIGALGVVYGDIGTSPLYAVNETFFGIGRTPATTQNVLGVISLIFWLLTLVVSVKYIFLVLRASYQGEGGMFALHELVAKLRRKRTGFILTLLVFGAALLLGDGVITPSISVLSAVEGLNVATPFFSPYVILITVAILTGLFLIQHKGTAKVGMLFGPVMIIWFGVIGLLGLIQMIKTPEILAALSPWYAILLVQHLGLYHFLLALSAIMLVVTGTEALYADLGHFAKRPIRQSWFSVAYWALVLNYMGQGAYLLSRQPVREDNIFFSMVPVVTLSTSTLTHLAPWLRSFLEHAPLYGLVLLATAATVIASEALITGAFSLASQAIALKRIPRLDVIHTSERHPGQIYVPVINWLLYFGCIALVCVFRTSGNLASAYGLAVAGVMIATTSAMFQVARYRWKWRWSYIVIIFGGFLLLDLTIFAASTLKFASGGYISICIATILFAIVASWRWGRTFITGAHNAYLEDAASKDMYWLSGLKGQLSQPEQESSKRRSLVETDRAVVFLISTPITDIHSPVPLILRLFIKRTGAMPRQVILLHIKQELQPYIDRADRIIATDLGHSIYAVEACFGFMQRPDGLSVLRMLREHNLIGPEFHRCAVEASDDVIYVNRHANRYDKLRVNVYLFFKSLSRPAYHYFRFDSKPGLSKTTIPILLGKQGWRIDIPEFALELNKATIDPDTHRPTDLQFHRFSAEP